MRIPHLDWPVDLFADAIAPSLKTGAMPFGAAATRTNLWDDMMEAWIARNACPESQWRTPPPEAMRLLSQAT